MTTRTPITRSLLDTDLNEFTMPQSFLHSFPGNRAVYEALRRYRRLRIDPPTKRLVFSDALDISKALALYRHFADRVPCGFGIGTNLTNDLGTPAPNIVMKLVECNGRPVAMRPARCSHRRKLSRVSTAGSRARVIGHLLVADDFSGQRRGRSAQRRELVRASLGTRPPCPRSPVEERRRYAMATSKKQAQALGIELSRERRAGKEIPPPPKGRYSEKTRQKALRDLAIGRRRKRRPAAKKRSR